MAKQGEGRGWRGDPERHREAGRKGGRVTSQKYGPQFYEEIGRRGGTISSGRFAPKSDRARQAGKKGGQTRKISPR